MPNGKKELQWAWSIFSISHETQGELLTGGGIHDAPALYRIQYILYLKHGERGHRGKSTTAGPFPITIPILLLA